MAYRVKEQRRVNRNEHKFYFSSFAAEFVALAALMAGAYSVGAAVGTARVNADWQRRWQIRGSRQQRRGLQELRNVQTPSAKIQAAEGRSQKEALKNLFNVN